jgi:GNAT superfamily N-acetyltransferase
MLKDYPKEIILRDGTGVTLRPLQQQDKDLLFRMFNGLTEDDRWFLDGDVADFGLIEDWVDRTDLKRVTSIAAVLEGRIIANATLMGTQYGARSHIGKVKMSVDPSFRGKNLGTWMLFELINLAMSTGLEILVLRLVEDRDGHIIRAARKLDFIEEALLKDYVKDRQGIRHNLVILVKHLYLGWEDEKYRSSLA